MHAVMVPVGSDPYAVPTDWVRQVLLAPPSTVLVTAPSVVMGLFNLRGEIVPLLDTAAILGVGVIETAAFVVVLHSINGPVGLAVTAVPERIALTGTASWSVLPGTSGTYYVDGRVVVLLDPSLLLGSAGLVGPLRPAESRA